MIYRDRKRAGIAGAARRVRKPRQDRLYRWTCAYCGKSFETPEYSQRYCSRYHRQLAYLDRKAQSGLPASGQGLDRK